MRTTLDIDDDVLAAVRDLARRERRTAGKTLSDLARRGLQAPAARDADHQSDTFLGFEPRPSRGVVVTNELIDALREEIGE